MKKERTSGKDITSKENPSEKIYPEKNSHHNSSKIKPGTIILFILLVLWIVLAIALPFLQFLLLFLITLPLFIYLLLRKKFGRIASFFLTLLLSFLLSLLVLGITGFVLYKDFLRLQEDFNTKTKYLVYENNGKIFVVYGVEKIGLGTPQTKILTQEEYSKLNKNNIISFILKKEFFEGVENQNNLNVPQTLSLLETPLPLEQKNSLFLNLLLVVVQKKGLVYVFQEFKAHHLEVEPTYLSINVLRAIPTSLVAQVANKDLPFLTQNH